MRRQKRERNPLLDKVLVGPLDAARLWGWKSGKSFKRNLPKIRALGTIRTVTLLNGTYYVLEDVLHARYPNMTDAQIQELVKEHQEQNIEIRKGPYQRRQWIGAEEAAIILSVPSAAILDQKLREFTKILTVERDGETYYDLGDCFRAAFQEIAEQNELDKLIIDYKKQRLQRGLNYHENLRNQQVSKPPSKEA